MNETFIARSYAKINLGLFVTGRLPGGYHGIETGFAFLDYSDWLEVKRAEATTISCNDPDVPTGKDNLITKAIRSFHQAFGTNGYFSIKLDKKIPAGAGLGGGSSNAAVMLRLLNRIYEKQIPLDDLCRVGAALGADVPVFVRAETAIGRGKGTELSYHPIQPGYHIVTAWPGIHSSTAEAYALCEPGGPPPEPLEEILTEYNPDEWSYLLRNDLEPPVISRYPQVGDLKDQLYDMGALYAAMSGSGSSVFGIFEQEVTAMETYQYLLSLDYRANYTPPGFRPDHGIYLKG
jgi:4-diphosphocytidyl-2-C-methyl-D-erythritol kinase